MYSSLSLLFLGIFIIAAGAVPGVRKDAAQNSPQSRSNLRKHTFGIYRGLKSDIKTYPYNAAISSRSTESFIGNGAILTRNWILVTGFEIDGYEADDLLVRLGSNDALSGGQTYGVSMIVRHSNYSGQLYNDLAMIKTTPKIVFTPAVNRVTLPYYSPVPYNVGNLTGYGSHEESSDYLLREGNFTVIPYDTCATYYKFLPSSGVFCADSKTYTAADDDLGAPFVRGNMLIGLYIGGYGWYPAIFNSILPWKDWINSQIKYA